MWDSACGQAREGTGSSTSLMRSYIGMGQKIPSVYSKRRKVERWKADPRMPDRIVRAEDPRPHDPYILSHAVPQHFLYAVRICEP
mgnify:CR=1 FL=1